MINFMRLGQQLQRKKIEKLDIGDVQINKLINNNLLYQLVEYQFTNLKRKKKTEKDIIIKAWINWASQIH